MRRLLVLALVAWLVDVPVAAAWTWPVDGPLLRPFVFGDDPYAAGQHRGIDIAGPAAGTIAAPAAGRVSFAGTVPHGGRTLTIETADGYSVTLVHVGTLGAAHGDVVGEGQPVGTLGPSGDAEWPEPYVHLGIRVTSDPQGYVDPQLLLPPRGASTSVVDDAPPVDGSRALAETPPAVPETAMPAEPDAGADHATPPALVVETPVAQAAPADAEPAAASPAPSDGGATITVPADEPAATSDSLRPAPTTETANPPAQTASASTFAPTPVSPDAATPAPEVAPPAGPADTETAKAPGQATPAPAFVPAPLSPDTPQPTRVIAPPAVPADVGLPAPADDAAPAGVGPAPYEGTPEAPPATPTEAAPTAGDAGERVDAPAVVVPEDAPAHTATARAMAPSTVSTAVGGSAFASTAEGAERRLPPIVGVRRSPRVEHVRTEARRRGETSEELGRTSPPIGHLAVRSPVNVGRASHHSVGTRSFRGVVAAGFRAGASAAAGPVPASVFAGGALLVLVAATLAGLGLRRRDARVRVPPASVAGPSCCYGAARRRIRPCRPVTAADALVAGLLAAAPPRPGPSRPLAGRSGRAVLAARRRRALASHAR